MQEPMFILCLFTKIPVKPLFNVEFSEKAKKEV